MDRTYASGAAGSPPSYPGSPSIGYPTAGNPGTGTPATKPGPWWYYMINEELRKVITDAGLTPDGSSVVQLKAALDVLYGPWRAPVVYTWGTWSPSATTNVQTSPSTGTLTLANAARITVGAISGGMQTFTFDKAGTYKVTMQIRGEHMGGFTVSRYKFTVGGTATRAGIIPTANFMADDTAQLEDGYVEVSIIVSATAGQTLTLKPISDTTVSATASHSYYASVIILPLT